MFAVQAMPVNYLALQALVLLTILVGGYAAADTSIQLRDGTELAGELISATETTVQFAVKGRVLVLPASTVASINFALPDDPIGQAGAIRSDSLDPAREISVRLLQGTDDPSGSTVLLETLDLTYLTSGAELPVGALLTGVQSDQSNDRLVGLEIKSAVSLGEQISLCCSTVERAVTAADEAIVYRPPADLGGAGGDPVDVENSVFRLFLKSVEQEED